VQNHKFLLAIIPSVAALFGASNLSSGGPNGGGTLLLHASPTIQYTTDQQYCGSSGLGAPDSVLAELPGETGLRPTIFHSIVASAEDARTRLSGVSFGLEYDEDRVAILASGSCADFQLPTGDWPASGAGVALTWNEARTDRIIEAYWFAALTYAGPLPSYIVVVPHPTAGGQFADDSVPAQLDPIAGYGSLGIGVPGIAPIPCSAPTGSGASLPDLGLGLGLGELSETRVLPPTFDSRDPIWTTLVVGPDASRISSATLIVSEQSVEPIAVLTTSPTSVLLTFDLPDGDQGQGAVLRLRTTERVLEYPLTATEHSGQPFEYLVRKKLELIPVEGRIGFDGDDRNHSLAEATTLYPRLRGWLQAAGVSSLRKVREGPEQDYIVEDASPEIREPLRYLGRVYVISTPASVNPRSIQEILRRCPDVTDVQVSPKTVQNAEPCDGHIVDTISPSQWHLQQLLANYAWCVTTGGNSASCAH